MPKIATEKLLDVTKYPNLCTLLEETDLAEIGQKALTGYTIDDNSREEWKKRNKEAMKLAMQVWEVKNSPFENAANVKYPLLSIAAIQFSSRAYPNIVQGMDVVKGKVIGDDPGGLKAAQTVRIQQHMNYQIMEQMEEWEENTDKLLTVLRVQGDLL